MIGNFFFFTLFLIIYSLYYFTRAFIIITLPVYLALFPLGNSVTFFPSLRLVLFVFDARSFPSLPSVQYLRQLLIRARVVRRILPNCVQRLIGILID